MRHRERTKCPPHSVGRIRPLAEAWRSRSGLPRRTFGAPRNDDDNADII